MLFFFFFCSLKQDIGEGKKKVGIVLSRCSRNFLCDTTEKKTANETCHDQSAVCTCLSVFVYLYRLDFVRPKLFTNGSISSDQGKISLSLSLLLVHFFFFWFPCLLACYDLFVRLLLILLTAIRIITAVDTLLSLLLVPFVQLLLRRNGRVLCTKSKRIGSICPNKEHRLVGIHCSSSYSSSHTKTQWVSLVILFDMITEHLN